MTQYARIQERYTWLSSDFGQSMAKRYFSDRVLDAIPRNKKGKRIGQMKGQLRWKKVIEGGWIREGAYHEAYGAQGRVERRVNCVIEVLIIDPYTETEYAVWEWRSGMDKPEQCEELLAELRGEAK